MAPSTDLSHAAPTASQAQPGSTPPPQPVSTPTTEPSQRGPGVRGILAGLIAALRFLLPLGHRQPPPDAGSFARAAPWFVPIGLAIGLLWAGAFRVSWRLYGDMVGVRVIPALTIVLLECLFTGPFLALGLARTAHLLIGAQPLKSGADRMMPLSPVGTMVLCLTILAQWVLIVSVPVASPWWPEPTDWRHLFNWMYPAPLYRPLLLAPIWGRWGILLAATIGRTGRHADAAVVDLCGQMRPGRLLLHALLPFALTAIYCSRSLNFVTGAILGLLVFAATYVVAVAMAHRGGGQTRDSIHAAGQIAQLAFLALYRALWPLIHG